MERFAPRYDPRALAFLQMSVSCAAFSASRVARQIEVPRGCDGLVRDRRHRRLRRCARLSRRDLGAGADDGRARGARLHARGAVRRAVRRPAALGAAGLVGWTGCAVMLAGIVLAEPAAACDAAGCSCARPMPDGRGPPGARLGFLFGAMTVALRSRSRSGEVRSSARCSCVLTALGGDARGQRGRRGLGSRRCLAVSARRSARARLLADPVHLRGA